MRAPITLIFLFVALGAVAQSWCPDGAGWSFGYWTSGAGAGDVSGVWISRYVGMETIGGLPAQRIEQTAHVHLIGSADTTTFAGNTLHTRYDDGVVYLWDAGAQEFDTVMIFHGAPGDRWEMIGFDGMLHFVITDTSTVWIDGFPLHRSAVEVQDEQGIAVERDTLTERIGFQHFHIDPLMTFFAMLDGPLVGSRCYHDDAIAYSAPNIIDCAFTVGMTAAEEAGSWSLRAGQGTLEVQLRHALREGRIVVHDVQGALVHERTITGDRTTIATTSWSPGVYLVRLVDKGRPLAVAKWVVADR